MLLSILPFVVAGVLLYAVLFFVFEGDWKRLGFAIIGGMLIGMFMM